MKTSADSTLSSPLRAGFAFKAKSSRRLYALGGLFHPVAALNGALGPDPDHRLGRSGLADELCSMPSASKTGSKTQTRIFCPPYSSQSGLPTSYPPKPD